MRQAQIVFAAVMVGSVLMAAPEAQAARCTKYRIASDSTTTSAYDPSTGASGPAQNVCLNASSPAGCPAGATLYGYPGPGWPVNLGTIPGAHWIWGPGISGGTSPAEGDSFTFYQYLNVPVGGIYAYLFVSADDYAEIWINGAYVGSVGSTVDVYQASYAQTWLSYFYIAPYLYAGYTNVLEVVGVNGPGSFAGCTDCSYRQNPAGVVFGGEVYYGCT